MLRDESANSFSDNTPQLLTRYGKIDYAWFDGFNWPGGLDFKHDKAKALLLKLQPDILLNPRYNNWGKAPKKNSIVATGERIDFELKDKTLSFTIPADKASSNLDVIKVEW